MSAIQDGWTHTKGGGLAAVTGVALPTLNGVSVERVDADVEDTADLLDQVAATRLPSTQEPATVSWICVQVRPASVVLNKPSPMHGPGGPPHIVQKPFLESTKLSPHAPASWPLVPQ